MYFVCVDAAWIQVSSGSVPVTAIFKTSSGFIHAGAIVAESNCWSMLKGGLTVDASGPAELYFEVFVFNYCMNSHKTIWTTFTRISFVNHTLDLRSTGLIQFESPE